jgi:hypothetical protein
MSEITVNRQDVNLVITESEESSVVASPSIVSSVVISSRGPQGPGGILGLYGSFTDTTDQPLVSTSAAQPITINTTLENRGVTIVSNSRITFELAGTYKVFASVQATNFSNNTVEIDFFLKKNGSTLANSNKTIDLDPRKSIGRPFHDRVTFEYQLTVATNDYVELWWTADHIDIILKTLAASATHPQAASVTLNVAQVTFAQTDAPRSITIAEPQVGDNFTLFRTRSTTAITSAIALVSNGSVTYELRYAADRTTAGTLATASDTVTNTTTGDSATVQNQPIPADRYVWIEITAVSGTVAEFNLSVAF